MIKAAVIGNPIKHSRSPLIHNHWLRKSGINGSYEALFAENEVEFINLIKKLRVSGYSGFNITVPFKKSAPSRTSIVIIFIFLGLIISTGYVLVKEPAIEIIKSIKS